MKRLALVALVVGALSTPLTSYAAPGAAPAALPRGADAHVTWLGGTTLHTGGGRTHAMPFSADRAPFLRLLGRSHHSWVIADLGEVQAPTSRVLRVHRGRYRTILTVDNYYDRPTYQLARDGDQIVTWDYDRGGTTASVYSWEGRLLGQRITEGFSQLLGVERDQVIFAGRHVARWTAGSPPVPFAESGLLADARHDALFVVTRKVAGPTSLSNPGTPTWTAGFVPRAFSPDGRWVAGYALESVREKTRRLEVRSMRDGTLQPSTGLRLPPNAALTWEDADHLLAGVHSDRGNALVRCGLGGRCERASDWLGDQAITVPHQVEYFFDWP